MAAVVTAELVAYNVRYPTAYIGLAMTKQRLQKFLAAAGVASRRKCEQLILDGVVRVNGRVVDTVPAFVDPETDAVTVSGKKIQPERTVCFLLNKPKGVICTSSDPQGRKKAIDLIRSRQRVFCVGRLDADSTGLVIITNDTKLANKLTHPRYRVPKTYVARVKGQIEAAAVEKLQTGIWLAEGKTAPAAVKILKRGRDESVIEITVRQGLNRQIRRMLAKVDLRVKALRRTRIGDLTIRGLGVGRSRTLSKAELAWLRKAAAD